MKKSIIIIVCITIIVLVGIFIGIKLTDKSQVNKNNETEDLYLPDVYENNIIVQTIEIASEVEKTTPNTLIIYKTYYTKCKHYIKKYEMIDVSKVNLTEEEFKEKYKNWKLDKFSSEEIELSKEEEKFCGQHYKIKLEDDIVVIYRVDEDEKEIEYQRTDITTKYLTNEDILKLSTGIIVYGKENLTATIEDYE